jgi:hypothetical protein
MNPSPVCSATLRSIAASGPDQRNVDHRSPEHPYSAAAATRVYEGVTIAAILLLLGSLWVF